MVYDWIGITLPIFSCVEIFYFSIYRLVNRIPCWWKINTNSSDSVVMMEVQNFEVTASCSDFTLNLYDGKSGAVDYKN